MEVSGTFFSVSKSFEWVLESPRRVKKLVECSRIDGFVLCLAYDIIVLFLLFWVYIRVNFQKGIFGVISPFKSQTILCWNSKLLDLD